MSSSTHTINGDLRLSKADRVLWIVRNWLNNSRATSQLDPALELFRFKTASAVADWSKIDMGASPSRRLSDLFWLSLPWRQITRELGDSVRVLEVGCGTGRYGLMLENCLGEGLARYVGLDIRHHVQWDEHQANVKLAFVCADSANTQQYLADANLIITQSALEHFEYDMEFFRQMAAHVAAATQPLIQIHLMPSAACLTTFPWHGVRQYTPRTVSRITTLFGTETTRHLYFLGSAACNRIHRRYIIYPWLLRRGDLRQKRLGEYDRELREAVQRDDISPKQNQACFHALVLQSRVRHRIEAPGAPV